MGHLSLKIQTSALFLKAKHAFSLHRKSSLSSNSSSTLSSPSTSPPSSSTPSELSSSQLFSSTALTTPPASSSSSSSTTGAGVAPHTNSTKATKTKRSSRFMVKTLSSFRDRSRSPPLSSLSVSSSATGPVSAGSTASTSSLSPPPSSSTSSLTAARTITGTVTATTATTTAPTPLNRTGSTSASALTATVVRSPSTTPPSQSAPVFSVNPYSSSWSPSTVAILKSPLRSRSSKASTSLDLTQCSIYSPAPNLILQPSPAIDLAPTYATGARISTSPTMLRRGTSETSSLLNYRAPAFGPQGKLSASIGHILHAY